jgi:hypothetical protein
MAIPKARLATDAFGALQALLKPAKAPVLAIPAVPPCDMLGSSRLERVLAWT